MILHTCTTRFLARLALTIALVGPALAVAEEGDTDAAGFSSGIEGATSSGNMKLEEVDLGIAASNHVQGLVSEVTDAGKSGTVRLQLDKPEDPPKETLFYEQAEVEQRTSALKARLATLIGGTSPDDKTSEERELELEKEIAMSRAYQSGNGHNNGNDGVKPNVVRLRLMELAFVIWDFLTHPLTIFVVLATGAFRLGLALYRVSRPRSKSGRRSSSGKHSGHRRSTRQAEPATAFEALTEYEEREERRRQRRYAGHRKSHRRRRWLDRFTSA